MLINCDLLHIKFLFKKKAFSSLKQNLEENSSRTKLLFKGLSNYTKTSLIHYCLLCFPTSYTLKRQSNLCIWPVKLLSDVKFPGSCVLFPWSPKKLNSEVPLYLCFY